ncbi:MAG: spore cortex biosynthesis protein YabQ [Clostridia bacterium]|nr:spore cortex biosynthesis protein YabQ [Clostridia bacterium]
MGISIAHQTIVFLYSVVFGAAAALFYDVFRIIRRRIRHLNFVVMIEDVLFWLAASAALFVFVYNTNSGELRAFLIIGAVLGAYLYFAALSRAVLLVLGAVFGVFIKAVYILTRPFAFLLRPIIRKAKSGAKKQGKFLRLLKKLFKFKIKSVILSLGIRKKSRRVTADEK